MRSVPWLRSRRVLLGFWCLGESRWRRKGFAGWARGVCGWDVVEILTRLGMLGFRRGGGGVCVCRMLFCRSGAAPVVSRGQQKRKEKKRGYETFLIDFGDSRRKLRLFIPFFSPAGPWDYG